jgi:hypothetical protein
MSFVGDPHRFGKQVRRLSDDQGKVCYEKPRSVRAESLLLGRNSPQNLFQQILGVDFGLNVQEVSEWLGRAEEVPNCVVSASERDLSIPYAEYCGKLLAAATLLGLGDLHSENIRICRVPNGLLPAGGP